MAHNLEIVEGKASMFYALDTGVPWHGLGTPVDTAKTSEEAIVLAGQDWDVSMEKIRLVDGPQIKTFRALVRDKDRRVLGISSEEYKIIQNREVFGFLDSLYADGRALYDTAGVIDNEGRMLIVWMLMRLTADMRIGDDTYANYLLATTSHDALRSLSFYTTKVRVVCENTLNMATGAKAAAIVRHTGDVGSKMAAAREVLKITTDQHRRMDEWLKKMAETEADATVVAKVEEKLFGSLDDATPTMRRNAIESFREIYAAEKERNGETAYTLVNTITGYGDHKTRVTKNGNRLQSVLGGTASIFKKTGFATIQELTGVKL